MNFRKTLDVNVVGAYNCSKSVSAHMLKQDYGRIINISSTNGMNTYYPMCIDYDASKSGAYFFNTQFWRLSLDPIFM